MSKTYFIVSDIHSYYDAFISALNKAHYDKNDPNHILIICGDVFDRGNGTRDLYNYLKTIPDNNIILIRGNHEDLYFDLLKKDFPQSHDFHNGTFKTFCHIANTEVPVSMSNIEDPYKFWSTIKTKVRRSAITKWLKSNKWKDYYEIGPYIFTHSFIPTKLKSDYAEYSNVQHKHSMPNFCFEPKLDWRTNSSQLDWSDARWGCPWQQFEHHLFDEEIKNNKILVCGHWHASAFHVEFEGPSIYENNEIYFGEHLIAIDGCTAKTGSVNVLVIKDNICYKTDGTKFKVIPKIETTSKGD